MFNKHDRHNHKLPVGVLLIKLALGIGGALIKKKLEDRNVSKDEPKGDGEASKRPSFWHAPSKARRA